MPETNYFDSNDANLEDSSSALVNHTEKSKNISAHIQIPFKKKEPSEGTDKASLVSRQVADYKHYPTAEKFKQSFKLKTSPRMKNRSVLL